MNRSLQPFRKCLISVFSCLLLMLSGHAALSAGIASNGKDIAVRWCANCHAVADEQASASADVLSFAELAMKYKNDLDALGNFLIDPHPVMPNFSLSRDEIKDLVAYIESLNE